MTFQKLRLNILISENVSGVIQNKIFCCRCQRDTSLEIIKKELWKVAEQYPLFHILGEPSLYIFVSITQVGIY